MGDRQQFVILWSLRVTTEKHVATFSLVGNTAKTHLGLVPAVDGSAVRIAGLEECHLHVDGVGEAAER